MTRLNTQLDPARRGREAESLASHLRKCIVGQDEAIEQIVNIYQKHLIGISSPDRPIANLLFLGPTGSGKTRMVEATAEALLGNSRRTHQKLETSGGQNLLAARGLRSEHKHDISLYAVP